MEQPAPVISMLPHLESTISFSEVLEAVTSGAVFSGTEPETPSETTSDGASCEPSVVLDSTPEIETPDPQTSVVLDTTTEDEQDIQMIIEPEEAPVVKADIQTSEQIKERIALLEKQLTDEPTAAGFTELAQLNARIKRYSYAEKNLIKALSYSSEDTNLMLELVDLALIQKNYPRAVTRALDIVHREFDNGRAHYYLGVAFSHMKKVDKAEKALNMAIKFDPSHDEARQALANLIVEPTKKKKKKKLIGLF